MIIDIVKSVFKTEKLSEDDNVMQLFLSRLFSFFMSLLSISNIKRILHKLKDYWNIADIPGKMLIMVFFTPSMVVLFWLLTEIAYFVVFTLPGIVIKIVALVFLFCIFWSAAVYSYEKLYRVLSDKTVDAEHTKGAKNAGSSENDESRKSMWRGKN